MSEDIGLRLWLMVLFELPPILVEVTSGFMPGGWGSC